MLSIFGGTIGLHRFYLGDVGGGIFYVVLMFMMSRFLPITTMLGIFEGIRLLMMSDDAFDKKYNGAAGSRQQRRSQRQQGRQQQRKSQRQGRQTNRQYEERRPQQARPQNKRKANPFKTSGIKKYKNFELEGAEKDLLEAVKINSRDAETHYTLAAIYSLNEKKDKAYHHLSQAVELGMQNLERVNTEDAFAYLRIQEDFDAYRKGGFRHSKAQQAKDVPEGDLLEDDVLLSQLNKLAELRKRGLLSESEFTLERKKLLRK